MATFPEIRSAFLTPNELLMPQKFALEQAETEQKMAGVDLEMVARAAGVLSDDSLYPTTEDKAAAYPRLRAELQSRGFGRNLPAEYPGDDRVRAVARMGT